MKQTRKYISSSTKTKKITDHHIEEFVTHFTRLVSIQELAIGKGVSDRTIKTWLKAIKIALVKIKSTNSVTELEIPLKEYLKICSEVEDDIISQTSSNNLIQGLLLINIKDFIHLEEVSCTTFEEFHDILMPRISCIANYNIDLYNQLSDINFDLFPISKKLEDYSTGVKSIDNFYQELNFFRGKMRGFNSSKTKTLNYQLVRYLFNYKTQINPIAATLYDISESERTVLERRILEDIGSCPIELH